MGGPHGGAGPHGTSLRLGTRSRHGRRAPRGAPLHGGRQRQIRGSAPSRGARVLEVRIHLPPAKSLRTFSPRAADNPLGYGSTPPLGTSQLKTTPPRHRRRVGSMKRSERGSSAIRDGERRIFG